MMDTTDAVAVVRAWQEAANTQNSARLLELSAPDIEIVGPRGSGYGHGLLKEWLERAGLHLTTLQAFARGDTVVLAQHGVWRSAETGEITGEQDLASAFRVSGRQVVRFERFSTLEAALEAAGLDLSDEISRDGQS